MTISAVGNGRQANHIDGSPSGRSAVKPYARIPQVLDIPDLVMNQIDSYNWFKEEGLSEVYQEISPIIGSNGKNEAKYELRFQKHYFKEPKYSPLECKEREITYSGPLYVNAQLLLRDTGEIKESEIFMGDIPLMTDNGSFIINGAERVVVSQLVRSPGAYFIYEKSSTSDRNLCFVKLIPARGAWLEFETGSRDVLSVKVDRKRKLSVTAFFRALGVANDEDILAYFADVDTDENHQYLRSTLERDPAPEEREFNFREDDLRQTWDWLKPDQNYDAGAARRIVSAQIEFYRRLKPGEPPSPENARNLIKSLFFDPRRYDLGRVGRYKFNRRLNLTERSDLRVLTLEDIIEIVREMILVNQGNGSPDDIDHLGNRRVRAVGELVQNQVRVGLSRMERMTKEKMTISDSETATPQSLLNIRPVVAAVREFFGGSQLSQFMDQTNPLAELTHKRRLSALGPGGLSRARAGFDVRDVHFSHYGRICPIETPEGPNIGLLSSLASYACTNPYGFIESPYRRVLKTISSAAPDLEGRTVTESVLDADGKVLVPKGRRISRARTRTLRALPEEIELSVRPYVVADPQYVEYMSADQEERFRIAQANSRLDDLGQFVNDRVEIRYGESYVQESTDQVDFMDVSPMQIMSISAALIPFLEHDDANRALMGSNMQRQAVPLLRPQVPVVSTGIEERVARDSGQVALARVDGVVTSVSGKNIVITEANGQDHPHNLVKFARTNQGTCFDQRTLVQKGDRVAKGAILADSSSTDQGKLALGQNVLVAFMSWEGYNYEDAIILSERLVKDDQFTSVHIAKHEMEARDTKLGAEEITRDIPNVGEASLRDLDERGIIRIGADVGPGDILVGKVTPKGETELTAEEKLLRAIFGDKSRDVKDTSLRVPHGERGKIIDVKALNRTNRDDLPPGVNEAIRVWIAQTRKISVGDKMAGRHGNKGVVARILSEEDMPFLDDGTPVDMILNPIGVPSRMNLGQVLETHLGWAARGLNFRALTPVFDGASDSAIEDSLARLWFAEQASAVDTGPTEWSPNIDYPQVEKWLKEKGYNPDRLFSDQFRGEARDACLRLWLQDAAGVESENLTAEEMYDASLKIHRDRQIAPPIFGKFRLYDGRTGEPFDQLVTVGSIYMLKLSHLVEDKIHARSTGPYSMITQQPLGGKAQFGGQRFGEMEVWALEAYSAAYNLQEVLTVKSDDVTGRSKTYEAIVKGEPIGQPGVPESFNVLLKELQSLGLAMELLNEEDRPALVDGLNGDSELYEPLEAI